MFAVIAVAMGSVYAATVVPSESWQQTFNFGLGGLFGDTILASLMNIMPGGGEVALKLLTVMIAAVFVGLMLYVTGFNRTELRHIMRFLGFGLLVAFNGLLLGLGRGAYRAGSAAKTMGIHWQERRAVNAERAAQDYAQRQTAKDLARAAAIGTARMVNADDEAPSATLGQTSALRADHRPAAAPEAAPLLSKLGGLIRRKDDPDKMIDDEDQPQYAAPSRLPARGADAYTSPVPAGRPQAKPFGRAPLAVDTRTSSPGLRSSEPPVTKPKSLPVTGAIWPEAEALPAPAELDAFDAEEDDIPAFSRAALAADRRPIVTLVQAPSKRVAPSRKAMAEAQPSLNFEAEPDATGGYELPPLSLLTPGSTIQRNQVSTEALEENARMLESVLEDYGVRGEIVSVRPGPVVTMYELEPAPGLKASRVIGLSDDIARSM
jgi:S-DNA-T family DNA segregation ATPase FtsK/SpoIIIE